MEWKVTEGLEGPEVEGDGDVLKFTLWKDDTGFCVDTGLEKDQGPHWVSSEESIALVWVIVLTWPRELAVETDKKSQIGEVFRGCIS